MKRQTSMMTRLVTLALCAASCAAFGQGQGSNQWGNGPGGDGPPPPPPRIPPVIRALDTDHDGTIDAGEIANAPESLKTLLKSGSTSLSIPDLLGPPHHGHRPRGPWQGQSQGSGQGNGQGPQMQLANPDSQSGPPPQDAQGGPGGPGSPGGPDTSGTSGGQGNNQDGPPPGPPPGGPGGPGGHRPLPPVIQALDTNQDGVIDADEIANAAQSLKTLLKSGSTSLSIPDLLGPPRFHRQGGQGNDNQDGPPPGPPPDDNGPPPQTGTNAQEGSQPPPPPPPPQ